jgi:3-phosphoshikimate 1-carboxyvinyltransferase
LDIKEINRAAGPIDGTVRPPGSKSITNRVLLLAALADGRSVIKSPSPGDDAERMLGALKALGFRVEVDRPAGSVVVQGLGGIVPARGAALDVGGAGTAMRFLAAFVTLGTGRFRLDGDARMRQRPVEGLLAGLRQLGVSARSESGNGCPPVMIEVAERPTGGPITLAASLSSQFASALLMPAPYWERGVELELVRPVGRPFIEMTLRLMERWGVKSRAQGAAIRVAGGQRYRCRHWVVEPDASAASYFAAAAALLGGSVTITGLGRPSLQGDAKFFGVLEAMGAAVKWREDAVRVTGSGRLAGVDVDLAEMPDMVATLAVLAPFADSPTRIRGVGFVRHHESDRLSALATELGRLGAQVEELDDGLAVEPSRLHGGVVETYNDHRIAMAFAVAGLKVGGVQLKNPGCVGKTYPGFFADLARVVAC